MIAVAAVICAADSAKDGQTAELIREIIRGAKDNSQRAERLLEAAERVSDDKKLQMALLEEALNYAMPGAGSAEGRGTAQKLLDFLDRHAPDRRALWSAKRVEFFRRRFRTASDPLQKDRAGRWLVRILLETAEGYEKDGKWREAAVAYREARAPAAFVKAPDEPVIYRKALRAELLMGARRKADRYIKGLKGKSNPETMRTALLRTLVVDLDHPVEAAKYVADDVDETWRIYVPLAAKDVSELNEASCRELAAWYNKELAPKTPPYFKHGLLLRAKRLYERFIELHQKHDTEFMAARMELDKLTRRLRKTCLYCGGTGRIGCAGCRDPDLKVCSRCGGKGRTKCPHCGGRWGRKCSRCKGTGTIRVERRDGPFTRTANEKCSSCRGTGWTWICPKCGKQAKSLRGTVECPDCNGSRYELCPRCRGKREIPCIHCGERPPPDSSGKRPRDDGAIDRPFEVQDKDSRKSPKERRGKRDRRREEMLRRLREAKRKAIKTKG